MDFDGKKTGLFRDGLNGLAAAVMLLPQSMAFGVALLTPFGVPAGRAALAGLICAAALCTVSGAVGGTSGLVSAPTGPMLILASAVLGLAAAGSLEPGQILLILTALVVLAGVGQILIGVSGGGRLIKFIPHSVTVGFLTGSAVLMLWSQYSPLVGAEAPAGIGGWIWVPGASAAVTIGIAAAASRFTDRVPPTILGLTGGVIFYHLLTAFSGVNFPDSWTIGHLPNAATLDLTFTIQDLADLPWPAIAAGAVAAAILSSVDTLLTAVVADMRTGDRHDARRELVGQGAGHIASGFLGGMAGAGTTGATSAAADGGGRRWVGVVAGLLIGAIVLFGGSIGTVLPKAVLSGVVIWVALGMLDYDIFTWMRSGRSRVDAAIAVLVALVTVVYDLLAAVAIGVGISIFLYLRMQVKAPVIHRKFSGEDFRSVCKRSRKQKKVLSKEAGAITICELRGDLFFATADQLFENLVDDLDGGGWLILNLRRVRNADITGTKILQQMAERIKDHGGELIFCEVHEGIGLGHDVGETISKLNSEGSKVDIRTFVNTDEALEYAEDRLLESKGAGDSELPDEVRFRDCDIFEGVDDSFAETLESATEKRRVSKGNSLFRKGDEGSSLYFLLKGEVDIRLETTEHHYKRIAKYKPGTVFGEVAFLNPGPRSADAVAVTDCDVAELTNESFKEYSREEKDAAIALLRELAKKQSEELRWSTHEIQRLGDW